VFEDISAVRHSSLTGKTALLRMVESLGYRFNRAVAGLQAEHLQAAPVPGGMPLDKLIIHIGNLIQTLNGAFQRKQPTYAECNIEQVKTEIVRLYETITALRDDELVALAMPDGGNIFYLLNGPLSDALWHMGQVAVYKRLLGIQSPNGGYYKGQRP